MKEIEMARQRHVVRVLREQARQSIMNKNDHDDESIAFVSQKSSRKDRKRSIKLAVAAAAV